jgi:hypothetical protein
MLDMMAGWMLFFFQRAGERSVCVCDRQAFDLRNKPELSVFSIRVNAFLPVNMFSVRPNHNRGPQTSGQWSVRRKDLSDEVLTQQKFRGDALDVSREPPLPGIATEAEHQRRQATRTRNSAYWGNLTEHDEPPCSPEAEAASNEKDSPGFLQQCVRKTKGIIHDLKHFSEVLPPGQTTPTFLGKLRYIATRDGRCGVSVGLGVLAGVIVLAIVGLLVGYGMSNSSKMASIVSMPTASWPGMPVASEVLPMASVPSAIGS